MISMVFSTTEMEVATYIYLMNETAGPKNTDHTISYFIHYMKSSGKVSS